MNTCQYYVRESGRWTVCGLSATETVGNVHYCAGHADMMRDYYDAEECEILVEVETSGAGAQVIGTCAADGRPIYRSHMAETIYHASDDGHVAATEEN